MRRILGLGVLMGVLASSAAAEERAAKTDAPQAPKAAPAESPKWKHAPGTYAVFQTEKGQIVCRLFPDKAPKTVANFVGLADGTKVKSRFYDGTKFHRVIPGFMIQGGDPAGTGEGGPGYEFDDEVDSGLKFDKPGLLAMANAGLRPDGHGTNGSQFFITDVPRGGYDRLPTHLTGHHTIFGEVVEGLSTVSVIADAPTKPDSNGMAVSPITLQSVTITVVSEPKAEAKPAEKPAPAAKESAERSAARAAAAPSAADALAAPAANSLMEDAGSADAVRGAVEPPKGDKP